MNKEVHCFCFAISYIPILPPDGGHDMKQIAICDNHCPPWLNRTEIKNKNLYFRKNNSSCQELWMSKCDRKLKWNCQDYGISPSVSRWNLRFMHSKMFEKKFKIFQKPYHNNSIILVTILWQWVIFSNLCLIAVTGECMYFFHKTFLDQYLLFILLYAIVCLFPLFSN
jgi:hypothetical protein